MSDSTANDSLPAAVAADPAEPTITPKKNGEYDGGKVVTTNDKPVVDEESRDSQEDDEEENAHNEEEDEDEDEGEGDEEEDEEGEDDAAEPATEKNGKHNGDEANGDEINGASKTRKRVSDPVAADSNDGSESSPNKKKTKTDDESQGADEGVAAAE